MIIVDFKTDGAALHAQYPTVTSGSAGVVRARFTTDSSWAGMALTAVFHTPRGDILMPLENGQCDFPAETTAKSGRVLVGLFGTDGERTLTSVFCPVQLSPGVPTDGENAANYTPGLYEQFAAKFARFENMTASAERGEVAAVTASEAGNAFCLHFTLPKGDKGEKGDPGKDGADGIGVYDAFVDADGCLYLYMTDGTVFAVGNVVGPQGPQGHTAREPIKIDAETGLLYRHENWGYDGLNLFDFLQEYYYHPLEALMYYAFYLGEENWEVPLGVYFDAENEIWRFSGYDAENNRICVGLPDAEYKVRFTWYSLPEKIFEGMTVTAESGDTAAVTKTETDGGVQLHFTIPKGEKGVDGYTPVRGTDYWTDADIAGIKGYVDDAILGGAW